MLNNTIKILVICLLLNILSPVLVPVAKKILSGIESTGVFKELSINVKR